MRTCFFFSFLSLFFFFLSLKFVAFYFTLLSCLPNLDMYDIQSCLTIILALTLPISKLYILESREVQHEVSICMLFSLGARDWENEYNLDIRGSMV